MLLPSGTFESYKLPITECLRQLAKGSGHFCSMGGSKESQEP